MSAPAIRVCQECRKPGRTVGFDGRGYSHPRCFRAASQAVADAAAFWKANLIYLSSGNYRWHRSAALPEGAIPGRIVPWNKVVKKSGLDLHELGKQLGFDDRSVRDEYARARKLWSV